MGTTRQSYALALIEQSGQYGPQWADNAQLTLALVTQFSQEDTTAAWNPAATEEPAPGSTPFNSVGVQNYPTDLVGIGATLRTWNNGYYENVLQTFSNPQSTAEQCVIAISNSPWGDWHDDPRAAIAMLDTVRGDTTKYYNAEVFGDGEWHFGSPASPTEFVYVGFDSLPNGTGYYLADSLGRVKQFGNAKFFGDASSHHLNKPLAGIKVTETGRGYWLYSQDGGVFAFGDAKFVGSAG